MEVINTSGRRKTSVARIYASRGKGQITVNGKDFKDYFPTDILRYKVTQALVTAKSEDKFDITATITGGGLTGQAEALRLAIAKAMVTTDEALKLAFKADKLLTRDPRMVERKKSGQKKARKRFQFSKR
ncbi:MAG: 30S ribosomal protein S9 [Bacteroidia bacterium]|nr:30S ribosomal protein S9 [Bacteroidia bacterium]